MTGRRIARHLGMATAALTTVVITSFGLTGYAYAGGGSSGQVLIDVPGDGHGWVHDSSHPLFHYDKFAPGASTSTTLALKNDSHSAAKLSVKAIQVHDDDNGCLRQETLAGDTTCGPGGGELGHVMRFSVYCLGGNGSPPLWSGTILDLEKGVTAPADLPAGASIKVRVTAELPHDAGNDTMTDQLGFDLQFTLTSDHYHHSATVVGERVHRNSEGLPFAELAVIPPSLGAFGWFARRRRGGRGRGGRASGTHRR
jgi:hypothetical protein